MTIKQKVITITSNNEYRSLNGHKYVKRRIKEDKNKEYYNNNRYKLLIQNKQIFHPKRTVYESDCRLQGRGARQPGT
jgi:CTP-dependent riboflavin kinase